MNAEEEKDRFISSDKCKRRQNLNL